MILMKTPRSSVYPSSFIIVSFVIWIAVSLRWVLEFIEQSHPYLWLLSAILAIYGILLGFQPFITKGSPLRAHIYLGVQTALIRIQLNNRQDELNRPMAANDTPIRFTVNSGDTPVPARSVLK